ncbi:A24 family peptidase [Terrihabitans soli]|nr:prepilin peptidase [Terrihabitans soli]
MTGLNYFLLIAFPALLVAAAVSDLVTMTIPNRIPLLILAVFAPAAWAAGLDLQLIGWHLAVGAIVLVVCFGMFAMNLIGGGDAKFAAAIALWIGPFYALLEWTLLFALYGGALTLLLLAFRRLPLPVSLMSRDWIARLHAPKGKVPYGIALSAAALTVYPASNIFLRLAV